MSDLAPEPAVEPEATPAVEPEGEAAWRPSQDEWNAAQETIAAMAQLLEAVAAAEQGDGPQPLDPFADDYEQRLLERVNSRVAPLEDRIAYYEMQEGSERSLDVLADLQAEHGEFLFKGEKPDEIDSTAWALAEAEARYPALLQQYRGDARRAATTALEQAYTAVRSWEDAVGKRYHEREINQLGTLGRAPVPPAPAAARNAGVQVVVPEGGDEVSLVRHYFNR